jgi:hypothetical protein
MAGLLSAALGFAAQGCFTPQPKPECAIINSPYFATLTNTGSTGTCSGNEVASNSLTSMQVAMNRFSSPGDTSFSMYVRTDFVVNLTQGGDYTCDDDLTNDCANTKAPGKCTYCIASGTGATAKFKDGGTAADTVASSDGGVQGIVYPAGDGGTRVSLANVCKVTQEQVGLSSTSDPTFAGIDNVLTTPQFPDSNSVCNLTPKSGGSLTLDPYTCADGTHFAGGIVKTDWSNFGVINSTKAPATYFTANLAITEGSCVTNYGVTGFWPIVSCDDGTGNPSEGLCNPIADPDAGTVASGISPFFKPKCDAMLFVCVSMETTANLKD